MAARVRTEAQRASDLEKIAHLYCRGRTQAEIARSLELSREQIAYDLREIRQMWRESAIRDFDAARDDVLGRVDHLEATAWRAWENSLTAAERQKVEKIDDGDGTAKSRTSLEKIATYGDPRFMGIICQCLDRRCKLLGLDAAIKVAPTTPDGKPATMKLAIEKMSDDELRTFIAISRRYQIANSANADGA
jgi:hypothetical protein